MTTHPFRSTFSGLSFAAPLVALSMLWPASARAESIDLTVTPNLPQSLGGDTPYFYKTVTIKDGGVLTVIPVGTDNGTGRLHIKANKIVIEASGVLNAAGAGHRGVSGKVGGGMGGGGYLVDSAGGGGAYFGDGAAGTNSMCATGIAGVGGMKYGVLETFGLGSAGGAGGKMPGPIGGNGGGSVILEAARIEIYGTINVSGKEGLSINSVGSGGGAGGEIRLTASQFTWGPKAQLIATGGIGGKAATASGGSGGGGLIHLQGTPLPPPEVVLDVAGGASPESACSAEGKGADGVIQADGMPVPCQDLDGDGVGASLCGQKDCDDSDATIKPGAKEDCDGRDNDCNDLIDDGDDVCAAGLVCIDQMCRAPMLPDAGPETDGGKPAAPEQVQYRGGCSVPTDTGSAAPFGIAGLVFALGAHLARRARRPRN